MTAFDLQYFLNYGYYTYFCQGTNKPWGLTWEDSICMIKTEESFTGAKVLTQLLPVFFNAWLGTELTQQVLVLTQLGWSLFPQQHVSNFKEIKLTFKVNYQSYAIRQCRDKLSFYIYVFLKKFLRSLTMCFQCLDSLEKSNALFMRINWSLYSPWNNVENLKLINVHSLCFAVNVICHMNNSKMHAHIRIFFITSHFVYKHFISLISSDTCLIYNHWRITFLFSLTFFIFTFKYSQFCTIKPNYKLQVHIYVILHIHAAFHTCKFLPFYIVIP